MSNVVPIKKRGLVNATGPRPVKVHYPFPLAPGNAKSIRNAIVNATRRMLRSDTNIIRANIEVDGVILADLDKISGRILITWRVVNAQRNHPLW